MTAALVAGLASLSVTAVWAAGPAAGEGQPAQAPASQPVTGTPIDRALRAMDLADDVRAKVAAVLTDWKAKADEQDKLIKDQCDALVAKVRAGPDPVERIELSKQFHELRKSSNFAARYKSVKAALKEVLTDEQLGRIDEAVKSHEAKRVASHMSNYVAWLEKTVPEFELDDAQKVKLGEAVKAVQEMLTQEDAAAVTLTANRVTTELHNKLVDEILTDAQRKQLIQFLEKTRQSRQGTTSQPASQSSKQVGPSTGR
jgi:hypothetical protein